MSYLEKLKDPRWQKKRLSVLQRDNWMCCFCNDTTTTLNVHHKSYNGLPWEVPDSELITLCQHCHALVEMAKSNSFEIIKIKKTNIKTGAYFICLLKDKNWGNFILTLNFASKMNSFEDAHYFFEMDFDDLFDILQFAKQKYNG